MMALVMQNRRPPRLPLYEHIISTTIMETIFGVQFAGLHHGGDLELRDFFRHYCGFFKAMTYDTVSYEVTVTDILPDHGAIMGGRPGPIQSRHDFECYPWDQLPELYWNVADRKFAALGRMMPSGMKAIGGIGNGVFEISEDLVGMEYLAYMQIDDPDLYRQLYQKIGEFLISLWKTFLERYGDFFVVCRMGDDLGFKSGFLVSPAVIREHLMPQYRRVVDLVHSYRKPFLWHSCGCIFDIMDEMIALGIDAKHSNEDQISLFDRWIELFGDKIGLLGGIDVNVLCQENPDDVKQKVLEDGRRFRKNARGFALGSGNSIPNYVPAEGYLAMIEAVQTLREE